ncbi:MAG: hypothetical protein J0I07_43640 [Myxococcales bacterium]|nr:hypothetical protein [Myxococcales bacterium]
MRPVIPCTLAKACHVMTLASRGGGGGGIGAGISTGAPAGGGNAVAAEGGSTGVLVWDRACDSASASSATARKSASARTTSSQSASWI